MLNIKLASMIELHTHTHTHTHTSNVLNNIYI